MVNNVIPLFLKEETVEEVIESAKNSGYEQLLIVGYDAEGKLRYRSNFPDLRGELSAIELIKHHIIMSEFLGYEP